jgi:ADP-ribose pyrophosphatase
MKQEKSCGAIVYRKNIKNEIEILLIKHENGGHWAFPKGHVEENETETETAAREIWEETGLKAEIDTDFRETVSYSPKENVIKEVVYFAAVPASGDIKRQEEEVAEISWSSVDNAMEKISYENDKLILRKFLSASR